ncbi:MAG: PD40 domain-containing protein [Bacteroidetes bacterium]|nr:PD40 domain-containing protein [Bacteroidota bacterium]
MIEQDSTKKWGAPVNLGSEVNTKFDEDSPFLWHDGTTLFFASQGHNSIGGYDIFMTSQPDPAQAWSKPVNVGYPLNTTDDDLYFTLSANARTGYVSGLKPGGMGDVDIWYFNLKDPLVRNAGSLYRASILSAQGLPAKDAMVSIVKEATGQVLAIMEANGPAAEIFMLLPAGKYKLKARSPKLGRLEQDIVITGEEGEKGIRQILKLQPNPSSKP